jgi:hypothetical protein
MKTRKPQWTLLELMDGLHQRVTQDLKIARAALAHPGAKGDASEEIWISLFKTYLPERYRVAKATICDSKGRFSDEIDVVVFDRQYTPFIFNFNDQLVIPCEAVYAVFESKQEISGTHIKYAQAKIATVRKLHRTSGDVQTVDGLKKKIVPKPIIGGFLAFECRWKKPIDNTLRRVLSLDQADGRIDLGCVAAYGTFGCDGADCLTSVSHARAATSFLLELISRLQKTGTVPAIEMAEYARWLT